MTVEFLVACFLMPGADVKQTIVDLLAGVLHDKGNDFEDSAVAAMVTLRHQRVGNKTEDDSGSARQHTIIGFALELPDETEFPKSVIDKFAEALLGDTSFLHVVKFEDPFLQAMLAKHSEEIFAIEMKLRRVLSLIYLHADQDSGRFYELLRYETFKPTNESNQQQMKEATENEFFNLTFRQYIRLGIRKVPTTTDDVINLLRDSKDYDTLLENLRRPRTIVNSGDTELLANIKEILNSIEAMRNCVAHYRRPSTEITTNYTSARNRLNERLDKYLAEWEL